MTDKQKGELTSLAGQVFELDNQIKELNKRRLGLKSEIEQIITDLGVAELVVEKLKFSLNSKSLKRFKKSEFAKEVDVDKKDVSEQLIAQLVENGKTSSTVVGGFIDVKASRTLRVKEVKEKKSKKK
jgi:regulator of replication initiation timing